MPMLPIPRRQDVDFKRLDPANEPLIQVINILEISDLPYNRKHLAIGVLRACIYTKLNKDYVAHLAYLCQEDEAEYTRVINLDPHIFSHEDAYPKWVYRAQPYPPLLQSGVSCDRLAFHPKGYAPVNTRTVAESADKVQQNIDVLEISVAQLLDITLADHADRLKNFVFKIKDSATGCVNDRLGESLTYLQNLAIAKEPIIDVDKLISDSPEYDVIRKLDQVDTLRNGHVPHPLYVSAYIDLFTTLQGKLLGTTKHQNYFKNDIRVLPQNIMLILKEFSICAKQILSLTETSLDDLDHFYLNSTQAWISYTRYIQVHIARAVKTQKGSPQRLITRLTEIDTNTTFNMVFKAEIAQHIKQVVAYLKIMLGTQFPDIKKIDANGLELVVPEFIYYAISSLINQPTFSDGNELNKFKELWIGKNAVVRSVISSVVEEDFRELLDPITQRKAIPVSRDRTKYYDQKSNQIIIRKVIPNVPLEQQPFITSSPPTTEKLRDIFSVRGQPKNTIFTKKKSAQFVSPFGKMRLFSIDGVHFVYDARELHDKGYKYVWSSNALTRTRPWIDTTNKTSSRMLTKDGLYQMLDHQTTQPFMNHEVMFGFSIYALRALFTIDHLLAKQHMFAKYIHYRKSYPHNMFAKYIHYRKSYPHKMPKLPLFIWDGNLEPRLYSEFIVKSDLIFSINELRLSVYSPYKQHLDVICDTLGIPKADLVNSAYTAASLAQLIYLEYQNLEQILSPDLQNIFLPQPTPEADATQYPPITFVQAQQELKKLPDSVLDNLGFICPISQSLMENPVRVQCGAMVKGKQGHIFNEEELLRTMEGVGGHGNTYTYSCPSCRGSWTEFMEADDLKASMILRAQQVIAGVKFSAAFSSQSRSYYSYFSSNVASSSSSSSSVGSSSNTMLNVFTLVRQKRDNEAFNLLGSLQQTGNLHVDLLDNDGFSLLGRTAENDCFKTARFLMQHSANATMKFGPGNMYACSYTAKTSKLRPEMKSYTMQQCKTKGIKYG